MTIYPVWSEIPFKINKIGLDKKMALFHKFKVSELSAGNDSAQN